MGCLTHIKLAELPHLNSAEQPTGSINVIFASSTNALYSQP